MFLVCVQHCIVGLWDKCKLQTFKEVSVINSSSLKLLIMSCSLVWCVWQTYEELAKQGKQRGVWPGASADLSWILTQIKLFFTEARCVQLNKSLFLICLRACVSLPSVLSVLQRRPH